MRPEDLDPFKNLVLFAEAIVEGWFSGKHRTLDFGANAEFAEHKAYVPGDPVEHIDWKVFARSRRLVVRKYREEKDMPGYLLVDTSRSMSYRPKGRDAKILRAARMAASLAYLMHRQGDKSALALFSDRLEKALPPGSTRGHLFELCSLLEDSCVGLGGLTAPHFALQQCLPLFRRRGCLVVISDFFVDLEALFDALGQFLHRKFRIMLLHVMDPDEYHLPDVPMARFIDLESNASIHVAPDEIREAYTQEMDTLIEKLKKESDRRGIHYHQLRTDQPYIEALEAWLGLRRQSLQPGASLARS
jgi:uncharacterized protein (DUF58 family)